MSCVFVPVRLVVDYQVNTHQSMPFAKYSLIQCMSLLYLCDFIFLQDGKPMSKAALKKQAKAAAVAEKKAARVIELAAAKV